MRGYVSRVVLNFPRGACSSMWSKTRGSRICTPVNISLRKPADGAIGALLWCFATLDFSGPRTDRSMLVTIRDADGAPLWTRTIRASELRYPRER